MSPASFWDTLHAWAVSTAGLELSAVQMGRLHAYLDTLLFWNRKVALVSQSEPEKIAFKHLADSLFAAAYCPDGESVVDLGSGAGLPGLVIGVVRAKSPVCLIESRARKVSFLCEAARTTSASNVTVFHGRIEDAAASPDHRGRYRIAVARALTQTAAFLRLARPFLTDGGLAVAMRPAGEPTPSPAARCTTVSYDLPDGTPRRLLLFGSVNRALAAPQDGNPVGFAHR